MNIGIDLGDEYITAYSLDDKRMISIPAVVCREKREDIWHIGEDAYQVALSGKGVLTDKLLSLLKKKGTSTISRKVYRAEELVSKLIKLVMHRLLDPSPVSELGSLVITVDMVTRQLLDSCMEIALLSDFEREKVHVISYEEAFIHYMLSLDKEYIFNMAGLFDLGGETLSFYKMKVVRGGDKLSAVSERETKEEAFRLEILKNESGSEIADRILLTAAKKYLGTDIYSSVVLTGKGFESTAWAGNFIGFICKKRKVIYEAGLFAIGAALHAKYLDNGDSPYRIFCDTRTKETLFIDVNIGNRKAKIIMAPMGSEWYDMDTYAEVVLKDQNYVDLGIDPVDRSKSRRYIRLTLSEFPKRPSRCTRVLIGVKYKDASNVRIVIKDQGFGEIFPSSGKSMEMMIRL